ncbi:MAG: hypothetical protein GEU83_15565 [Pseudonocardiaceae bacterium]|nr:hypothetical protein [Pseudonocardiaceae bacterium]
MNSRRRITAALVALLVLVTVAWLVQQATSEERSLAPVSGGVLALMCTRPSSAWWWAVRPSDLPVLPPRPWRPVE